MNEAIKEFIGKNCIITTMNENVIGQIEAVEDKWVIINAAESKNNGREIISIDYISRICELVEKKHKKR